MTGSSSRRPGGKAQVASSVVMLAAGNVLLLLGSVLLARAHTEHDFGRINFAFTAAAFLSIFCKVGFDQALTFYYPRYGASPSARGSLVAVALIATTIVSVTVSALIVVASGAIGAVISVPWFADDAFWIAASTASLSLSLAAMAALNATGRSDLRSFVAYVITPGAFLVWVGVLALVEGSTVSDVLLARAITTLLSASLAALLFLRVSRLRIHELRPIKHADTGGWIRYAATSVLGGLTIYLAENATMLLLGALRSPSELAYYTVAARCAAPLLLLRLVLGAVLDPRVAERHHQGEMLAQQRLVQRAAAGLLVASSLAAGALITGRHLLTVVFGDAYGRSEFPLLVLAPTYAIGAWLGIGSSILMMNGAPRAELVNAAGTMLLNIVLAAVLIPAHGAAGGAVATSVAIVFMGSMRLVQSTRLVGWSFITRIQLLVLVTCAVAVGLAEVAGLASPWLRLAVFLGVMSAALLVFRRRSGHAR